MEKLVELKERLQAISEFASESVKLIDELMTPAEAEKPASKPTPKAEKGGKVANPAPVKAEEPAPAEEEDELAGIIAEYELDKMTVAELKELLNETGVEYDKKAKNPAVLAGVVAQAIIDGKIEFKDDEEDSEDEAPAEEKKEFNPDDVNELAEEYGVSEMDSDEIKEFLDAYEIAYLPKAKKQTLLMILVKAIFEGVIPLEDEEDDADSDGGDDDGEEASPVSEDDDSEDTEVEKSPEVLKAEAEVRKGIEKQIKAGKLTVKKAREFLKQYYEGDADCKDCKGCTDEETYKCYIAIHQALIDDDGDVMEMGSPYERNGVSFCCGQELKELENGNLYCEICGEEWATGD